MAEKVQVTPVGQPNRVVLMDARVAQALVTRGRFNYVTKEEVVEEPATDEPVAKPKKRAYKRRDMKAED